MQSLTIVGRRWFQKSYGNTYHTVEIIIDGKPAHTTDRTYGYGRQYVYTALAWLKANGHIPADLPDHEGLSTYCREKGIAYAETVIDVARRKDL